MKCDIAMKSILPEQHDSVLELPVEFDQVRVIHQPKPDGGAQSVHGEPVGILEVAGEHPEEADHLGVVIVREHPELLRGHEPPGPGVQLLPGKVSEGELGGGARVILHELPLLEELEGGELLDVVLVANLPTGVAAVDVGKDDRLGRDLLPYLCGGLSKLRPGL